MIKAIVLSCDRYHKITDHMIETYQKLWPTNKLKFLIPWNKVYPQFLVDNKSTLFSLESLFHIFIILNAFFGLSAFISKVDCPMNFLNLP